MTHNELYRLLDLPEEVIHKLKAYGEIRDSTFHIEISDLMKDSELTLNLDKVIMNEIGEDPDGIKMLWEELNIALQSFAEYQKKGIPTDIFEDTMKFCRRFLLEHYKTYACYRFVWGWWLPRQLSLREFRISALEYEFWDDKYVYIHIPSDADFSQQSVLQSLSQFKAFCRQYYPEWEEREMQCDSWLLSPELKNVLNADSNILAFQKLFHVAETDLESRAVLDWVFPGFDKVSENLPEETSLQRNAKKYLLEGKKIGSAKGILVYPIL